METNLQLQFNLCFNSSVRNVFLQGRKTQGPRTFFHFRMHTKMILAHEV